MLPNRQASSLRAQTDRDWTFPSFASRIEVTAAAVRFASRDRIVLSTAENTSFKRKNVFAIPQRVNRERRSLCPWPQKK